MMVKWIERLRSTRTFLSTSACSPCRKPMGIAEPKPQTGSLKPYFALSVGETLKLLDVSGSAGLSDEEVRRRAFVHGPNALLSRRRTSAAS